ncbi:MAG: hypothetical protein FD174_3328 [Geobacteraceae bacterium]|nr:MAG: hypothetical protein FD174_3328 [Geobacteraceae bacterium]
MKNHDDIRKQLSAYCGGDLEPAERIRLEEHLAECDSCRVELVDLQTTLRLIRTIPELEPPAWLVTRITARVREQQQEKRSWLQRIFFPLHIKLPIEFAALLLVCVSGYYLARNVETELKQPAIRQDIPAATPKTDKPAGALKKKVPAAETPTPEPPAAKKELRSEETMPAQPSASKAADQGAPQHVLESPGKPSPQPAFAPAPPVMKEERGAPAAEALSGGASPYQPGHGAKSAKHAKKAAAEMEKEAPGAGERDMLKSEAAGGASAAPAGVALPKAKIRLDLIAPASAPGSLKEAVTRSGGSVIDNGLVRPHAIKARIPSLRMGELLEQLGCLGRVVERPQTRDLSGMVEIEIVW